MPPAVVKRGRDSTLKLQPPKKAHCLRLQSVCTQFVSLLVYTLKLQEWGQWAILRLVGKVGYGFSHRREVGHLICFKAFIPGFCCLQHISCRKQFILAYPI